MTTFATDITSGEVKEDLSALLQKKPAGRVDEFVLLRYNECPKYLLHNEYVMTGYRVNYSLKKCILSIFKYHNETLNIWTHLLGFLLFFILAVVTPAAMFDHPSVWDVFIFSIFTLSAQIQMLGSAIFHIFHCYSERWYSWLAKLDYCGITIMIVGSYYPPLYYGFACFQPWRIAYMTIITVVGFIGLIMSVIPVFATPRFRTLRTGFFLVFGLFAVIPLPHLAILNGISKLGPLIWREAVMGASYVIGALVYLSRIPERWFPGRFDYSLGNSHVVWHYFTIVAALFQWSACVYLYNNRQMLSHCN